MDVIVIKTKGKTDLFLILREYSHYICLNYEHILIKVYEYLNGRI